MKLALGVALLALPVTACSGHGRAAPQAITTPATTASEQGLVLHSVWPLAQAIAAEGYRLVGAVEQGFLAPSARAVQPVVIEPRTCVAIVAAATASVSDLDAALYAADGSVLAEDDGSDARPVVRLCSGPTRIDGYLALYAYQGAGSYALLRLEKALGPHDAASKTELDAEAGSPAFAELLRGLRSRGYEPDWPIVDVKLVAGAPMRFASKVLAGHCYGVIADGERLQVRLLDAQGRELALGIGSEGPAALQYCADASADLTLELSAHGDVRAAHLARLHAQQVAVGGARAVWLGEPSVAAAHDRSDDAPLAKRDGCAEKARSVLREEELAQGSMIERPLLTEAACTLIEAALHGGLSRVTLRVEAAQGEVIAERDVFGALGFLRFCGGLPAQRLSVIGRTGFGSVSVTRADCVEARGSARERTRE